MTAANFIRSAEEQVAQRLCELSGGRWQDSFFIADEFDLQGKVNVAGFVLDGGLEQEQAMEAGADYFYATGTVRGVFDERIKAQSFASCLLHQGSLPFGSDGEDPRLPNVLKCYLRTTPTFKRERRKLAIFKSDKLVTLVQFEVGVAFRKVEE